MLEIDKKVWENTEAKEFGEYENLELGGHPCIIIGADQYTSQQTGNVSLRIQVDIDKGDKQEGFFKKQFENNQNEDKKWSTSATKYFSLKEENYSILKGFITAVENSNPGFKFDMDEKKLLGKKIAGVFGLEEYERQSDGRVATTTKLTQIRSLDKLNEIRIPRVKKLNGEYVNYDEYIKNRATASAEEVFGSSIVETANIEDQLPFEI